MPRREECLLLGPLRDIWRLGMLRMGPGLSVRIRVCNPSALFLGIQSRDYLSSHEQEGTHVQMLN